MIVVEFGVRRSCVTCLRSSAIYISLRLTTIAFTFAKQSQLGVVCPQHFVLNHVEGECNKCVPEPGVALIMYDSDSNVCNILMCVKSHKHIDINLACTYEKHSGSIVIYMV